VIKKILYILDGRQKRNFIILGFVIMCSSLVELLGVALISPIVTVVTNEEIINENEIYICLGKMFHLETVRQYVIFLIIVTVGIYLLKNIYVIMQNYLQYRYVYNNRRRMTAEFMKFYMNKEYIFHTAINVAEIQRNIVSDVQSFWDTLLNVFFCFNEGLVCVVLVVYLAIQDPVSTMAIATILGGFVGAFYVFYRKYSVKLGAKSRVASAEESKCLLQGFAGIKEIKVMGKEEFFTKRYDKAILEHITLLRKNAFVNMIPKPVMEFVCVGGLLIIIGCRIVAGADLRTFIPILSVFAVAAFRMLPSFNRLTAYAGTILYGKTAVEHVYQDMMEWKMLHSKVQKKEEDDFIFPLQTDICLKGITFKYPAAEENVLENIDLIIPHKKTVALIGASGAGKSTLADVILGILKPQNGEILVDGVNVLEHLNPWHSMVGYIPQMICLLDDSIRNNIAFGIDENDIDEKSLWNAVREAQLEEFILSLPEGLDTIVGDRGVRLSGGQRQRIGIARALYTNPEVLIMDEATSALDNETEKAIMEAIDRLHGSRTMLIIAHRLTTIANSDYIYEVGNKTVVQRSKEEVFG